jgi:riboflavin kinase / FMN adenylyltransferase
MLTLSDQTAVVPALRGAAVAIGNFDGLHLGHQALLRYALGQAANTGAPSGVITFEPHPRSVFQPEQPLFRLSPPRLKAALVKAFGAEFCAAIRFDRTLAAVEAEEFVMRYLVGHLGISHIVSGYDFHFGKGRRGNPQLLQDLGQVHGFGVTIVDQVTREDGASPYGSSSIRAALRAGHIDAANQQLGYRWTIIGKVVEGDRRGRTIGFPTVNIMLEPGMEPCHGIYAVRVRDLTEDRATVVRGAAYFGWRPTFNTDRVFLEVYLLDFEGELYGHELAVEFVTMVRPDRKFDSLDALVAQMKQDCIEIDAVLDHAGGTAPAGASALLAAQLDGTLYDYL